MALTKKAQQEYRDRLTEERTRTVGDMERLDAEVVTLGTSQQDEGGGFGNHMADNATDVMEQERNMALSGNLQERLHDIDHAIARLDAGTYGTCERCGKAIAPGRLEALPFATLCIDCKALEDDQPRPAML